ncbi:follistatin-A-like isoform X1 [Stegostoma tigrinum]|uniref:follistatin-A-like isoform X1 n=1 Tax=Stegostoma tigrinum TaxID=3053191 RepID=UPI00202B7534|nr:follistatin-A-like isoform X1 [Stegostoma tigrinum]
MLRMLNSRTASLTISLFIFLTIGDQRVQAGNCWLQQAKNGKCQVLYMTGVSREECCKSGRLGTAWTEDDVPSSTLFRWIIFNGGAPGCTPCKETCDNVDCGPGKKCKMNKKNKPRCVCAPDCSNVTWKGSVCGTDGKTYKDECVLLKARCKGHPELEVQYQGKCKKSCRDVLCPGSSVCVVDQTNSAYCVMCNPRICPEPSSPEQYLCGNDGITYASACHIRRATCLMGRTIGVAYEGKCIKAKSCDDIQCTPGKKCLWDSRLGRGRCAVCNVCQGGRSDEPVCATDNTTYPNECAMKSTACSSGTLLEIKHTGSCNSTIYSPIAITEEDEDEEDEQENNTFPKSPFPIW